MRKAFPVNLVSKFLRNFFPTQSDLQGAGVADRPPPVNQMSCSGNWRPACPNSPLLWTVNIILQNHLGTIVLHRSFASSPRTGTRVAPNHWFTALMLKYPADCSGRLIRNTNNLNNTPASFRLTKPKTTALGTSRTNRV